MKIRITLGAGTLFSNPFKKTKDYTLRIGTTADGVRYDWRSYGPPGGGFAACLERPKMRKSGVTLHDY